MYIGGRDRQYRPYMVMQPALIIELQPDPLEALAAMFIQMAFVNRTMLLDGKIENLIMILNLEGLGVFNTPYSIMKPVQQISQKINIGRQRAMFALNAPTTFSMLFSAASLVAPASVLAKLQVTTGNTNELLSQMIAPE